MKTILIIAAIFCVYKILSGLSARQKEAARKSEAERIRQEQEAIRAEQARQREQIKAQIERAKLETKERIEAEKRRIEWQKHQDSINLKMAKEQQRQAEVLEKHEEMLRKHEFQIRQAKRDIEFLKDRLAQQESMKDYLLLQQNSLIPGSKEHDAIQKKIITLDNQIHTTKSKYHRAVFQMSEARRKVG